MRKLSVLIVLLFVSIPLLAGCASGDKWYHPYGPPYFGNKTASKQVSSPDEFVGLPRP